MAGANDLLTRSAHELHAVGLLSGWEGQDRYCLGESFDLGRLTRMLRPAGRSRSGEVAGVLLLAEGGQFLPILALTLIVGIVIGDATDLLTPRASLGFGGILATAIASLAAGWRILRG